jgi:hypothetical protein
MFDLQDETQRRITHAKSPIDHFNDDPEAPRKVHRLDMPQAAKIHAQLLDSYVRELDKQTENRFEQSIDEDFYDSIQWDENDANTLRDRGQVPLVYNVIKASVNWVIGTEKRTRTDFKILPRRKEQSKPAEKKSALLKYLADCNRTPFHNSRGFADSVKVGIGWLEDGYQEDEGEELYSRYESWRNMVYDSAAVELDLSDARYIFRQKWVDLDIALALAPDRKALIEQSSKDGDRFFLSTDYGDFAMDQPELENEGNSGRSTDPQRFQRTRVRVIEAWFRRPVQAYRVKGGSFNGELFDPYSPGHVEPVMEGEASVVKKPMMRMYCALMTVGGLLYLGPSPYRHNRFPFTPIWGYRRGRDGLPYGMIRDLRDIQADINKRASKALHILSTTTTIMEEGAVDDVNEFIEEVSRPDRVVVVKQGKKLTIESDRDLAKAHLDLMTRSIQMIQQAGGVTDENLGRKTNATSGIAIEARQDQGAVTTTHFFDNLRFARQVQGEKQLCNIEQFMSDEKQFRITNMRGGADFITVNDGLPENDIVRSKADYIISEADWRASLRQAQVDALLDALMKIAPAAPQIALTMLDLVVENMDLPNREELVRRIRQVTGMRDPDADEPTPEEIARAKEQQEQQEIAKATALAQLRKLLAEAGKTEAQTEDFIAKIASTNVGTQRAAVETAAALAATPAIAPVADNIAREAGFESRTQRQRAAEPVAA